MILIDSPIDLDRILRNINSVVAGLSNIEVTGNHNVILGKSQNSNTNKGSMIMGENHVVSNSNHDASLSFK